MQRYAHSPQISLRTDACHRANRWYNVVNLQAKHIMNTSTVNNMVLSITEVVINGIEHSLVAQMLLQSEFNVV